MLAGYGARRLIIECDDCSPISTAGRSRILPTHTVGTGAATRVQGLCAYARFSADNTDDTPCHLCVICTFGLLSVLCSGTGECVICTFRRLYRTFASNCQLKSSVALDLSA